LAYSIQMAEPADNWYINSQFFATVKNETDRAAAVLAAAFIDELLLRYLKKRLSVPDLESLYGSDGAVGSFSRRIAVAQALGWLHVDTAHDLNVLRRIRNKFAHDFDHNLSFAAQSISDQTRNFRVLTAMQSEVKAIAVNLPQSPEAASAIAEALASISQPRQLFELAVLMLAAAIAEGMMQPFSAATNAPSAASIASKQVAAMFSDAGA
jgi:hypothetical protein